jgi:hypothetical protein
MSGRRCGATSANGSPCRAWAVRGSSPPRCSAHREHPAWGAPPGNRHALKHGYYADELPEECTIGAIIANLYQRQIQLDHYIDHVLPTASIEEISHLLRIHGQNASRLGRLLRDRRALSGESSDGISGAIAQALDELGTELGTDPT